MNPSYLGHRPRLLVFPTCTIWLMLDRLNATGAVCGVVWTLFSLLVLIGLFEGINEEWVHPNKL